MSNVDNIFANLAFAQFQSTISDITERIMASGKLPSTRSCQVAYDKDLYDKHGKEASYNYTIRGGFNREVSKLMVDLVNFLTDTPKGKSNVKNIQFALNIMGDFIPEPIKIKKLRTKKSANFSALFLQCIYKIFNSPYGFIFTYHKNNIENIRAL